MRENLVMQRRRRQLCGCLVGLSGVIGQLSCTDSPASVISLDPDGFTATVARDLNASDIPSPASTTQPLTIQTRSISGDPIRIALDRIYLACKADQAQCVGIERSFVSRIADLLRTVATLPTLGKLRAVVRPRSYVSANPLLSSATSQELDLGLPDQIVAMVYADLPTAMAALTSKSLSRLDISLQRAFEIGLDNTRADLPPLDKVIQPLSGREIGLLNHSAYESSRLLLHADWAELSQRFHGHLLVAVPSAEELLYANGTDPTALVALSLLARDQFTKAQRPISPSVFEWRPEGWAAVAGPVPGT